MMEPSPRTAPVAVARRFSEAPPVTLKTAKYSAAKVPISGVDSIYTCHTKTGVAFPVGESWFFF